MPGDVGGEGGFWVSAFSYEKGAPHSKVYQVRHIVFKRLGGLKIDGERVFRPSDTYLLMRLVYIDKQAAPFTSWLESATRHFFTRPYEDSA